MTRATGATECAHSRLSDLYYLNMNYPKSGDVTAPSPIHLKVCALAHALDQLIQKEEEQAGHTSGKPASPSSYRHPERRHDHPDADRRPPSPSSTTGNSECVRGHAGHCDRAQDRREAPDWARELGERRATACSACAAHLSEASRGGGVGQGSGAVSASACVRAQPAQSARSVDRSRARSVDRPTPPAGQLATGGLAPNRGASPATPSDGRASPPRGEQTCDQPLGASSPPSCVSGAGQGSGAYRAGVPVVSQSQSERDGRQGQPAHPARSVDRSGARSVDRPAPSAGQLTAGWMHAGRISETMLGGGDYDDMIVSRGVFDQRHLQSTLHQRSR